MLITLHGSEKNRKKESTKSAVLRQVTVDCVQCAAIAFAVVVVEFTVCWFVLEFKEKRREHNGNGIKK
jgi:hypothetical protein